MPTSTIISLAGTKDAIQMRCSTLMDIWPPIPMWPMPTSTRSSIINNLVGAKAAIHPAQVDVINEAFTPSHSDVEWAQRVIAVFAAPGGGGVAAIDGKMLDRPHLRSAQRVLQRARGAGALD